MKLLYFWLLIEAVLILLALHTDLPEFKGIYVVSMIMIANIAMIVRVCSCK